MDAEFAVLGLLHLRELVLEIPLKRFELNAK